MIGHIFDLFLELPFSQTIVLFLLVESQLILLDKRFGSQTIFFLSQLAIVLFILNLRLLCFQILFVLFTEIDAGSAIKRLVGFESEAVADGSLRAFIGMRMIEAEGGLLWTCTMR